MIEKFDKRFFHWLKESAIRRNEEHLKAPWFYFDSCQLSPYVLRINKLPAKEGLDWGCDNDQFDIYYFARKVFLHGYDNCKENHHLKIFLN